MSQGGSPVVSQGGAQQGPFLLDTTVLQGHELAEVILKFCSTSYCCVDIDHMCQHDHMCQPGEID